MYCYSDFGVTSDKLLDEKSGVTIPHFLYPSLNCSLELNKKNELIQNNILNYRPMPYKDTLPLPLNDPLMLDEERVRGVDHVTNLISDKSVWENEKNDLIYKNARLKTKLCCETDDIISNWNRISKETIRLADHIDTDPDPNFSGFYNWYYSDGCLNNVSHNNVTSLLYTNDSLPGTCICTPVEIKKLECSLLKDNSVFFNTGHNQRIFQITINNNFVAIRQKNYTSLLTISSDNELHFNKIHNHSETKDSIVSVSVSNDLDGKYCTLTASRILKLWSPNVKNDCINCVNIDNNDASDYWGSVKYVMNNNILVSDREYVYLKDTRIELKQNVQKWKVQVKDGPCNFISMLMKSHVEENCAYIGTLHNLYELDFRKGLSKQWTHMMEFPPMYGESNLVNESNETLFIGSQSINEICAINRDLHVMPYILSSTDETLSEVNLQGLCLDPGVASRFNFSMTGLTTVKNNYRNNCAFVFRSTSIGDIFSQSVILKDGCNNDSYHSSVDLDSVSKWEVKCEKSVDMSSHSLKLTDVVDFKKMIGRDYLKPSRSENQNFSGSNKLDWMIDVRRLMEPLDKYSQSLVGVWDIETTKTEELDIVSNPGPFTADAKSKQYSCNSQTKNDYHYEEREKCINKSDFALNGICHEQFSLKGSRNRKQNIGSSSFDLGSVVNSDTLHFGGQNEVNHEEYSNPTTSNLSTPKRIAGNEVKSKVRVSFDSGSAMDWDYLNFEGRNEVNFKVFDSPPTTSNLSTPKKIVENEVKRKARKKARFTSGF